MARPTTQHIAEVRVRIRQRLADGAFRPGDRFLSTRAFAGRYGISYQTAHRLLAELVAGGQLERRSGAGTFVAGRASPLLKARLVFHPLARRRLGFGHHLLWLLEKALRSAGIPYEKMFSDAPASAADSRGTYTVVWENLPLAASLARERHFALLLSDPPPPGVVASYLDSVSTDDFSGGICAAEVTAGEVGTKAHCVVITGPRDDGSTARRTLGFCSHYPRAAIVHAEDWAVEAGYAAATAALRQSPHAVFCASDRLAQYFLNYCRAARRPHPPLVGFDDAPIAHEMNLTTIAVPWEGIVAGALALIKRRMAGDVSVASQQILAPRPVMRGSHLRVPLR